MKVAVIGAGIIGGKHLNILATEPGVEVVGIVSATPERADAAARRWGGNPYTSYEQLLAQEPQIDAAWINVPPWAHGPMEMDLIKRGIPFFVEKPLATDRRIPQEIAAALEKSGLLVAVGYHWRAMDTVPEVRAAVAQTPPRMVVGTWQDKVPPPTWWRHQATSGGQIVEQATHLFDLARYLVGEAAVKSATAIRYPLADYPDADVATASAALLRFKQGASGVFTATCLLGGPAAQNVQLVCEGLLVTITQKGASYDMGQRRLEVALGNDPYRTEDQAFLEAVRRNDPSLVFCSYLDALRTHQLCLEVMEAAQQEESSL